MIKGKKDLKQYLEQDKIALGKKYRKPKIIHDEIWKFEILLRKTEYFVNCREDLFGKIWSYVLQIVYYKRRLKYNTYVPLNTFGPGLSIAHLGSIVVNGNAMIGKNCRIQEGVTIGTTNGSNNAPTIGDNCFLGSGAKIIGNVKIAADIAIGANAVVVSSFEEPGITIGGIPAKKISNNNSHSNLNENIFKNMNSLDK